MPNNLKKLKGPGRSEAVELVRLAQGMSREDAITVERSWMDDDDLTAYYAVCDRVWTALEDSGRFLYLGWFENVFSDAVWFPDTKALHPVADAVMATLVSDLISKIDYDQMTVHLKKIIEYSRC